VSNNYLNKIICGNCVDVMQSIDNDFIDLTITSPPYDNLRDYHEYQFDYKSVIKQLFRITKFGGVVVWIVNDSVIKGSETGTSFRQALSFIEAGFNLHDTMIFSKNTSSFPARRHGNRYTQIFEYMFVFSRGAPKTANLICDKENKWAGWTNWGTNTHRNKAGELVKTKDIKPVPDFSPRNNIWQYVVSGGYGHSDKLAYEHPATFPEQLVTDNLMTWSNEGDVILDPMCGSGTTCKMAKKNKRNFIGIEVSSEFCSLAERRLELVKT